MRGCLCICVHFCAHATSLPHLNREKGVRGARRRQVVCFGKNINTLLYLHIASSCLKYCTVYWNIKKPLNLLKVPLQTPKCFSAYNRQCLDAYKSCEYLLYFYYSLILLEEDILRNNLMCSSMCEYVLRQKKAYHLNRKRCMNVWWIKNTVLERAQPRVKGIIQGSVGQLKNISLDHGSVIDVYSLIVGSECWMLDIFAFWS